MRFSCVFFGFGGNKWTSPIEYRRFGGCLRKIITGQKIDVQIFRPRLERLGPELCIAAARYCLATPEHLVMRDGDIGGRKSCCKCHQTLAG